MIDIREDIRWLRTNPVYNKIQQDTQNLSFAQNLLIFDTVKESPGADESSVEFMCNLYVDSGKIPRPPKSDEPELVHDVQEFAHRLCSDSNQTN